MDSNLSSQSSTGSITPSNDSPCNGSVNCWPSNNSWPSNDWVKSTGSYSSGWPSNSSNSSPRDGLLSTGGSSNGDFGSGNVPCENAVRSANYIPNGFFDMSDLQHLEQPLLATVLLEPSKMETCKCGEAEVVLECVQCKEYFCRTCIAIHNLSPSTQHHTSILSISCIKHQLAKRAAVNVKDFCDKHKQPFTGVCEPCQVRVCNTCLLAEHSQHERRHLEEDPYDYNQRLSGEVRTTSATVCNIMASLIKQSQDIQNLCSFTKAEVERAFRQIRIELEQRADELKLQIDHVAHVHRTKVMEQLCNMGGAYSHLSEMKQLLETGSRSSGRELMLTNQAVFAGFAKMTTLKSDMKRAHSTPSLTMEFQASDNGLVDLIRTFAQINTDVNVDDRAVQNYSRVVRPIYGTREAISLRNRYRKVPSVYGVQGSKKGQFCRPWGVTVNKEGHILVADRSNDRIQVFDSEMRFLYMFGKSGNKPGQFNRPAGICVSPYNLIVVGDKDNHRIQIFTMNGTYVHSFGGQGKRNGQFHYPWDVACNVQGDILVSDTRNRRLQLFTSAGVFIAEFSTGTKMLDSPRGVCFTPAGQIVVTEFNNNYVIKFEGPGFRYPKIYYGNNGTNESIFLRPQGIIADDDGYFLVTDTKNHRIRVFDPEFNQVDSVGTFGKAPGEFDRPCGIALGVKGEIIIVDFENTRIQIYRQSRFCGKLATRK